MSVLRVTLWHQHSRVHTRGWTDLSGEGGGRQAKLLTSVSPLSEMAERHNAKQILQLARDLVHKVQILIENK